MLTYIGKVSLRFLIVILMIPFGIVLASGVLLAVFLMALLAFFGWLFIVDTDAAQTAVLCIPERIMKSWDKLITKAIKKVT